ncbi:NADH-quinone oxidoreductase subunit N [Geothrix limicola]|uniref:NADH-quinone oxidoreductase subunit N n=1 Tax=Geothrix limicola TaxID=2927978 RepID=A0ABQ5Q9Q6_9BACT|nr:NADH-quinone oxidoreductase subunit N [Geothrix limicola]GLH71560.1 NADH-quinone oxidoreductase subunit N [Geothrix limicola]
MSGFAQGLLDALLRDSRLITPQLFLMTVATLMLWPGDLFFNRNEKHKWAPITLLILAATAVLVMKTPDGEGFSRMFRMDGLTRGFELLCVLGSAGAVALSVKLLDSLKQQTVEYYALILFSLSGMLFLCGASDLISVYFSIELMAICIYVLVAYLRDRATSVEAGLKYFLLGAFSSAILVYGISLLYGAAGGVTTNLADLNQALALTPGTSNLLVYAGVLMVLVGMGFKVAAVPFHMWAPDAYEGAPTPITAFMATAPKAAALAAFLRVFGTGFHGVSSDWVQPLCYIAGASMILGNVAAVKQVSMKRLLAYSSIAHVGYMLLGILSGDPKAGAQAVWLYMLIYIVMNTGAFAVVIYLQGKGEGERIEDFRGLGKKRPVLAFAMMVFLLSLAGIPPLVGFFGKFYLFKLAIEQGYVTLTVLALLTSAVSAYYYLGVVSQMYFREPEGEAVPMGAASVFIISVASALVLVGTAFGPWLLDWAGRIFWV